MKRTKNFVSIFLALILVFTSVVLFYSNSRINTAYADNKDTSLISDETGTEDDPYVLSTASDLTDLATMVNNGTDYAGCYFVLENDIDLSSINWISIGTDSNPFKGNFNGRYKSITGLSLSKGNSGLFGYVENATIEKLFVKCTNISCDDTTGVIAKQATDTALKYIDISITNITAPTYDIVNFGILVGKAVGCEIIGIETSASIDFSAVNAENIGGVVGCVESSRVSSSISKTDIVASADNCGGIIGLATDTEITTCRNDGSVSSSGNVGGIAGKVVLNNNTSANYNNLVNRPETYSIPILDEENITVGGTVGSNATNSGGIFGSILFEKANTDYNVTLRYNYSICLISDSVNAAGLYGNISASSNTKSVYLLLGNCYVINNFNNCTNSKPVYIIDNSSASKFEIDLVKNDLGESTLFATDVSENTTLISAETLPNLNVEIQFNADSQSSNTVIVFMKNNLFGYNYAPTQEYIYPMLSWEFFNGGDGSESDPYLIKNNYSMGILNYLCTQSTNSDAFNASSYLAINNNISFDKPENSSNEFFFSGHFDGDMNYFTFSELDYGFFSTVTESAVVENILFSDQYTYIYNQTQLLAYYTSAIVAAKNNGTIRNILSLTDLIFDQNYSYTGNEINVAVICALNYGTIENCVNAGNIYCKSFNFVPIFGFVSSINYGTIQNCCNIGDIRIMGTIPSWITKQCLISGISAQNYKGATLQNCYFAGNIVYEEDLKTSVLVDPISIYADSTIINCYYNGSITDFNQYPSNNISKSLYVDEMVTLPEYSKPTGFVDFDENIWYFKECNEDTKTFYYPQLIVFKNVIELSVTLNKATFLSMTGNSDDDFVRYFIQGSVLKQPTDPVYSGYEFDSWHLNEDLTNKYYFTYPVNNDITLYAKWKLMPPEIILKSNKENNTIFVKDNLILSFEIISENKNLSIKNCVWYRTDERIFPDRTFPTYTINSLDEAATYYCMVEFIDSKNRTAISTSNNLTVYVNKLIPDVDTPIIDGEYFTTDVLGDVKLPSGWTWDDDLSIGLTPGENFYYATYTPLDSDYETVTRQISFDVTDLGVLIFLSILIPILLILLILALIYLLWLLWFRKYTLYFVTCGGEEIKPYKIRGNAKLNLPVAYKTGMAFGGWYLDGNFYQPCELEVMPKNNTVLYAKWYYPYDSLYVIKNYENYGTGAIKLLPQSTSEQNIKLQPVIAEKEIAAAVDATIVKHKESLFKRLKNKIKLNNSDILNEFSDVKHGKNSKKTKVVKITDDEISGKNTQPETITEEKPLRPINFFAVQNPYSLVQNADAQHSDAQQPLKAKETKEPVSDKKSENKKIVEMVSPIKAPIDLNSKEEKVSFNAADKENPYDNKAVVDLDFAKKLSDLKSKPASESNAKPVSAVPSSESAKPVSAAPSSEKKNKPKLIKAKPKTDKVNTEKKAETKPVDKINSEPAKAPAKTTATTETSTEKKKPVLKIADENKKSEVLPAAKKTEPATNKKTTAPVGAEKKPSAPVGTEKKMVESSNTAKKPSAESVKKAEEAKKPEIKKEPILKKAKPKTDSTASKSDALQNAQKKPSDNTVKNSDKTANESTAKKPVDKAANAVKKPVEKTANESTVKKPVTKTADTNKPVNKEKQVAKPVAENSNAKPKEERKVIKAKPKTTATKEEPKKQTAPQKAKPVAEKPIRKPAVPADKPEENKLVPVSVSPANKILIRDRKGNGYLRPVTERAGIDKHIPMDASIEKVTTKVEDRQVDNPVLIKKDQPTKTGLSASSNKKYAAGSQTVETTKYVTVETTEYYIDDDFQSDIEAVKKDIENAEKSIKNDKENEKQNIIMDKIEFKD